ncbi:MAG: GNAT family protein [Proteobacteria bacterium]|nr:GNAT family protein [Pseudomonadota bacterium]
MKGITIKVFNLHDIDYLFTIADESIFKWLPYGPFKNVKEMIGLYKSLMNSNEIFTVIDNESICGVFALKNIDLKHRKCEIGHIWYGLKYQRTKVNTIAMYLALSLCFDERRYRKVSWKCDELNKQSNLCAKRLGFKKEGVFRQDQIVKGRNKDTAWYGMTDLDWQNIKGNYIKVIDEPEKYKLSQLNKI